MKRARKVIVTTVAIVVLLIVGFFAWNVTAGPLKSRADMNAFADSLEQCRPFVRDMVMLPGVPNLEYAVTGPKKGRCEVRMETHGPHVIHCAFDESALPVLAQEFRRLGDAVGVFGGVTFQYSSNDPDPLTQALNSDACDSVEE